MLTLTNYQISLRDSFSPVDSYYEKLITAHDIIEKVISWIC